MFIKLTRLDGSPIWLNASFVVTIEPRKGGGSVVVPVGDGLDYDVREMPEKVLNLLADAPAPAIVPIPSGDALTKTPDDVSAESSRPEIVVVSQPVEAKPAEPPPAPPAEPSPVEAEPAAAEEKPKAAKKTTRTRKTAKAKADAETGEAATEEKPKAVRKTRAKATRKATPGAETPAPEEAAPQEKPAVPEEPKAEEPPPPPPPPPPPEKTPMPLDDDQIDRLRKLTPRNMQRLKNTLAAQFRNADCDTTIKALVDHGVIVIGEQGRILWA